MKPLNAMKPLLALLGFAIVVWIWTIGLMGADGILSNQSGTTTVGGGGSASVIFTNNLVSVNVNSSGIFTWTNYAAASLGGSFNTNGNFSSAATIGAGPFNASTSSIQMNGGGGTSAGYLEFFKSSGPTRLGYLGFSTTDIPLTLQNSADFKIIGGNQQNSGTIAATNGFLIPTNYTSAGFTPVAGYIKIASSNGVLYKITQLSTNLINSTVP